MGKLIITAICCLTAFFLNFNSSFAQRVSLDDLLFVIDHKIPAVESYLMGKGFNFREVSKIDQSDVYTYSKNPSHSIDYLSISFDMCNRVTYSASVFFLHKNDYLYLKKQIEQSDFKYSNTINADDGIRHIYSYKDREITIDITNIKNDVNNYFISLTDYQRMEESDCFKN